MDEVRDWLPRDALGHEVVREMLEQAVAGWTERWFVGAYASIAAARVVAADPRGANDEGWRVYRHSVGIRVTRPALARMVEKALDLAGPPPSPPSEADTYLLAGLERKILQDLTEAIEQAFGLPGDLSPDPRKIADPFAGAGGLAVSLADPAGRDILTLGLPAAAAWTRLKTRLAPPRRRTERFEPLARPLGAVDVGIEAVIGGVELTLAELNDLAAGDVLILDRRLDQPVDVAGVASGAIVAIATLTSLDDGIALVFSA